MRTRTWFRLFVLYVLLSGCGGGGGGQPPNPPPPAPTPRFTVGGQVDGLRGSGLELQMGQGERLAIQANGAFVFPTSLVAGSQYAVTVSAQPTHLSQVCTVNRGSGTISGGVTDIIVFCGLATFRVSGTLSGLQGTDLSLRLQPSPGLGTLPPQFASPSADGRFEFPTALEDGTVYEMTIESPPAKPFQSCVMANGSGTLDGSGATAASVTCTTPTFVLSGTVSNLHGQGLELTNNGGDPVTISSNGAFAFPTPLVDSTPFNVQVQTRPSNLTQTCFITNASGVIARSDYGIVTVDCTATQQLGSTGDEEALTAATDASGNLYVAGRTTGDLDGAPNAGGWDGFLFKFTSGGELRWKRQLRTAADETIETLKVTGNGDIYIAGSTSGSLEGTNAGSSDAFVAKYDRDGTVLWIRQLGTAASDKAHDLEARSDGLYIVGETSGALGGSLAGESDLFVAKLDASGTVTWLRQLGSPASDVAFGVSVDAVGTAYVAGGTAGNLDGVSNVSGGEAGFIVTYDVMGTKQTTRLLCQTGCFPNPPMIRRQSRINSIDVGLSGESYVAGWARDDVSGNFSPRKALASRIEANGVSAWSQTTSNLGFDTEMSDIVLGKLDGGLYISGFVSGATSSGFATRIDPTTMQQAFFKVLFLGPFEPISPAAHVHALAIASDLLSNSFVVGKTSVGLHGNQHLGGTDIFIVRYNEAGQQQ